MDPKARLKRAKERVSILVGRKFGQWTVSGFAGLRGGRVVRIRCSCGHVRAERVDLLGRSVSCGCLVAPRGSKKDLTAYRLRVRMEVRKIRSENTSYYMYELARKRAEVRSGSVEFRLRSEDIKVPEFCPLSGERLASKTGPTSPVPMRKNPARGWVRGNVVVLARSVANALEVTRRTMKEQSGWANPDGWQESPLNPEELFAQKERLLRLGCESMDGLTRLLGRKALSSWREAFTS